MSKIQDLLKDKIDVIDYKKIVEDYPWIIEKGHNCILSPDSDGLLCGLFMSNILGWKIKGFYDGKVMLLEKGCLPSDCIFLDMEVFRKKIRSVGHHMVLFNKRRVPVDWNNYKNCIQPNNFRNYDGYNDFRLKYPLATIHLLLGIVGSKILLDVPETAICPLFFTDGTFNVLFKYPENVLNWLHYLRADQEGSPLKKIFENEKYTVIKLMKSMDKFFRQRDEISIRNERGDRLRISETNGDPVNITKNGESYEIESGTVERIVKFLKLLGGLTGWEYLDSNWLWRNLSLYKFTKKDFKGDKKRLNNMNYDDFLSKMPLTWAMTSGDNIEYTFEDPDKML